MKTFSTLIFVLFFSMELFASPPSLDKKDFSTWLRSDVAKFGCFLEKEFKVKDKKFNCQLKTYENTGDPCKNTKAYYEGPEFPESKLDEVDNRISAIHLSWEHGDLQAIQVTLNQVYSDKEVRALFTLPADATISSCGQKNTCVVLTGFDHIGAGDVDCP